MAKKSRPWNYQPKYKIGTAVMAKSIRSLGVITNIDNLRNKEYGESAMPEYYILWEKNGGFTRHDCEEFDEGDATIVGGFHQQTIIPLNRVGQILYGRR